MKLATGAMAAAGLALALVGCHKDGGASSDPSASRPADEVDAMWKLAPDNLVVGFVASGRAVELASHVVPTLLDLMKLPEMQQFAPMITAGLTEAGMPNGQFLDLGFAAKPCAVFAMKTGKPIVIMPLGDRDKLVKSLKGKRDGDVDQIQELKCKTVSGVYACAEDLAQLDHLGKGAVPGKAAVGGIRGDIEVYAPELPIPGMPSALSVVIGLDPGQVDVRAFLAGAPSGPLTVARMMKPLAVDPNRLGGFATFDIGPALLGAPSIPLVGGVSASDVAHSLKGPILVTLPAGEFDVQVHAPLNDPKPISTLLEHCGDLAGAGLPIKVTAHDGACRIESPQVPGVGLDIWVEGNELRAGSKKGSPAKGKDVPLTAVGKELASGDWTVAMWGRGSLLAPSVVPFQLPPGLLPPEAKVALRAMGMMSEIGMGVKIGDDGVRVRLSFRTAFGNPPDVVKKILDISPDDFLSGKAGDKAKAIAADSPSAPFAGDVTSGQTGMMLPAAIIGILAAVAVPAFMDYMKASKKTETSLQLNRIGKAAKRYYGENSKFPIGDVAAPPTCCGRASNPQTKEIDNKCPVDAAEWQQGPWKELEFSVDEPSNYRFSYHSDGKSVTAKAIGDLDCDGQDAVFTLEVTVDPSGLPVMNITKPPAGSF